MMIGMDEAGRGPVLGPLVLSGVQIKKEDEKKLKKFKVKDSKQLSPKIREKLYEKIKETTENTTTIIIEAGEIDNLRKIKSLNIIELEAFAQIINSNTAKTVYLDLPEYNTDFAERLKAKANREIHLIAEHKADAKYPVVSAASIIAKVTRDRIISDLENKIGIPIGSGYPSDPVTIEFINTYFKENGNFPHFARLSWNTLKRIADQKKQCKLTGF